MLCCDFLLGNLVSAKVFLGFRVPGVLAQDWIVLLQTKFVRRIHRILLGVIMSVTSFFTNEPNNLTLVAFFSHYFFTSLFLGITTASTT